MARVRMADVAAEVGVSIKTVSNVINGTGSVGAAVRAQVLEAIAELGYRPNLAARQLRSGSSGLLALCIPNLREPYFAEFAAEFVDTAGRRGLTVLVTQGKADRAVELAMLENENLPALDGLVLSPLTLTPADIAARRSTVPLVLIGEQAEPLASNAIAHVGPDNAAAAEAATEFLLRGGRRRIAAIGLQSSPFDRTALVRFAGYERALTRAGIPLQPELLIEVEHYNRAAGSRAIEGLIANGIDFDGVFCFNDTLAFGALHTLGMHGISVPGQVQIVGYDNIEESRFTIPPLTSIDPGVASASDLILDLLADADRRHGHITAPFALVER